MPAETKELQKFVQLTLTQDEAVYVAIMAAHHQGMHDEDMDQVVDVARQFVAALWDANTPISHTAWHSLYQKIYDMAKSMRLPGINLVEITIDDLNEESPNDT